MTLADRSAGVVIRHNADSTEQSSSEADSYQDGQVSQILVRNQYGVYVIILAESFDRQTSFKNSINTVLPSTLRSHQRY